MNKIETENDGYEVLYPFESTNFEEKIQSILEYETKLCFQKSVDSMSYIYILFSKSKGKLLDGVYIKIFVVAHADSVDFSSYLQFEDNTNKFLGFCHVSLSDKDKISSTLKEYTNQFKLIGKVMKEDFKVGYFSFCSDKDIYRVRSEEYYDELNCEDKGAVDCVMARTIYKEIVHYILSDGLYKDSKFDLHDVIDITCKLSSLDEMETKGRLFFSIIHISHSDIDEFKCIAIPFSRYDEQKEALSNLFLNENLCDLSRGMSLYLHEAEKFGKEVIKEIEAKKLEGEKTNLLYNFAMDVSDCITKVIYKLTDNHNVKININKEIV